MGSTLFSRFLRTSLFLVSLISLTGCLYPNEQSPNSGVSARESVLMVQDAVNRYKEQTGLLPIQNAKEDTALYEKYKVDFGKLKRMNFISQIPSAAFESGGSYQFLVIDEETEPQVKVLDLVAFQTVGNVQSKVNGYRINHDNKNPSADELYPGFFTINFKELEMDSPDVISDYSNQSLSLILDEQGNVYVDYGIDIATAIRKSKVEPAPTADLRRALIEASYFVPVRSPIYHWVNGEPQAVK